MALGASYTDLLTPGGFQNFQQQLGVSGGNPGRPLARRLNAGQGALALNQLGFRMGLEPQRQSAIMNLLRNMNPANRQAQVDAFARRAQERAQQFGEQTQGTLQGLGYGTGAQSGAVANLFSQGLGDVNNFEAMLSSPEGQTAALAAILQSIGQAFDPNLAQMVLGGQGAIQQSNMMREQSGGALGDIMGIIGQAAGGGAFNGLFGRPQSSQMIWGPRVS